GHGSWYYAVQVATIGGRKARYRRGGFATRGTAPPPPQGTPRRPAGGGVDGGAVAAVLARAGRTAPAPVDRARLPRPHRPLPHPQHRPDHPRPPHRQTPAGLLQPAITPAHKERHADRRLHR